MCLGSAPRPLLAQGDWGVTRTPTRPTANPARPRRPAAPLDAGNPQTLIDRYLSVLATDADQPFALQRLLDLYRQRDGNLDRLAVDLADRAQQHERTEYSYLVVLGDVERARNQADQARAAYERAIALSPTRSTALRALALLDLDQGDAPRAQELLKRAVDASAPGDGRRQLIRKLAELALDADDYDAAAEQFARLAEGGGVYLAAEFARALADKGELARAVVEYQRVIARLRGDPRILPPLLVELAKAQLGADDTDAAIATLHSARKTVGVSGLGREIDETLVEAYRRAGRLGEFAISLQQRARSHDELSLLGRVWDEAGDSAKALAAYERALKTKPNAIDLRVRVMALLSREGRLDEVIAQYRALIRVAPREPRFVIELAQLLMETGRRTEALALLSRTGAQHPRDVRLHEALAQLYSRWSESERAAAEFTLLTRIAPDDAMHLVVLGEDQMAQGDREGALATWRRIVRVSDSPAKAHLTLGELMVDHDMLPEAIQEYREALKLEADNAIAARGLAEALERSRRDQEAATQWLRVVELAGDDRAMRREGRRRLIAIWARTNQLKDRLAEYARHFSLSEDAPNRDTEAGRFLAEGYDRLARDRAPQAAHFRNQSELVLRRIVVLEPADTEALTALEQLLAARGDLDEAITMLERLVLADPPRARSYLARMASYALQLYRDDQAIEYAERSVALNTEDALAHQRVGELYRAKQNTEKAIDSFERAVKLNDRLYDVYFALADLHLARGHNTEADRHLRHVMRACPDDELVARATRASIQLHLGDDSLATLEADLLPLALGHPQRPIFRRLVVELYDVLAQPEHVVGTSDADATQASETSETSTLQAMAKRAIKPLLEALSDQDPDQQRAAVRILSRLHHPNATVPLLALAESEADMNLRRDALLVVGEVASDDVAPRLGAIAAGTQRRLRDVAAWALARLGTRDALNELGKLLDNSLPVVRAYAVLGLGAAQDGRWKTALTTLLRNDRSPLVRSASALALAALGGSDVVAALTTSMRSQDQDVTGTAIVALGLLGDSASVPVLADVLFATQTTLQRRALWALQQIGAKSTFSPDRLVTRPTTRGELILWEPDLRDLEWAPLVHVAERFPDAVSLAIRKGLSGPRETVQTVLNALSQALGDGGPKEAGASLQQVVLALGAALSELAAHPEVQVRIGAMNLLLRANAPEADALLERALRDPDATVRTAAVQSMRVTPSADMSLRVAELVRLAREASTWSMRLQAVEAMGEVGRRDPNVCDALVEATTTDPYAYVRERAASLLGSACGQRAVTALRRVAQSDPEVRVQMAARAALEAP